MAHSFKICYRRLKPSDERQLIKFLYKQWQLPGSAPKLAPEKLLARSYAYELLRQQSRTYIAETDGKIAGIIMGRVLNNSGAAAHSADQPQRARVTHASAAPPHRAAVTHTTAVHTAADSPRQVVAAHAAAAPYRVAAALKFTARRALILALMGVTEKGRGYRVLLESLDQADRQLTHSCEGSFDGELVFFMVDRHLRGIGIGTSLLQLFHQYMRRQGVRRIYVLTDTGCDYDFYDRHEFSRLRKQRVKLSSERLEFTCYMYQYVY